MSTRENIRLIARAPYSIKSCAVGVDRPMKAPSMHIQKHYKGKIV